MWSHPISRKHRARSIVRVRNAHPASYSIKGDGPEAPLILALHACTARSRFQISSWRCAYTGVQLELEHTEKQRADRPSKISPSANTANVLGSGTPGVGSGGETSPTSRLKRPAIALKSNGSPTAYGPRPNSHDVSERQVSQPLRPFNSIDSTGRYGSGAEIREFTSAPYLGRSPHALTSRSCTSRRKPWKSLA